MTTDVLLLGAGSHGRLLSEQLESDSNLQMSGFTDPDVQRETIRGYEVLGTDEDVPTLFEKGVFDVALVGVGDSNLDIRRELKDRLKEWGVPMLTFAHESSVVAESAQLGNGTVVLPQSYVGTNTVIGDNVVVYSSVTIEHDCEVASDAYLSPGAVLCGNVSVGKQALIGANATILPGCTVGDEAVVGAGAVVTQDVSAGEQVTGIPAKSVDGRQ